jgi:hypothetical protein
MKLRISSPTSLLWIFIHVVVLLLGIILFISSSTPFGDTYKAILQGVGGSLIATGVAGEVLFLYVRASETLRARIELMDESGIFKIFPVRSVQIRHEYDALLKRAKTIDIIGFGLSSLREDYASDFPAWSRQANVRILLLDAAYPSKKSSYAAQRDAEEGQYIGKISRDVQAFVEEVSQNDNIVKQRFQFRLLRTLPSINMFRIDEYCFWGPYLALQQSRNTPTMLVKGGFLHARLREHFDSLWNSDRFSQPIS